MFVWQADRWIAVLVTCNWPTGCLARKSLENNIYKEGGKFVKGFSIQFFTVVFHSSPPSLLLFNQQLATASDWSRNAAPHSPLSLVRSWSWMCSSSCNCLTKPSFGLMQGLLFFTWWNASWKEKFFSFIKNAITTVADLLTPALQWTSTCSSLVRQDRR